MSEAGGGLKNGQEPVARERAGSSITDVDVFAILHATAHGRDAAAADRYTGEQMRARAAAMGWRLVQEGAGDA